MLVGRFVYGSFSHEDLVTVLNVVQEACREDKRLKYKDLTAVWVTS